MAQGNDFNVCWEFNSAAGCKMGKWCRWTHKRLARKPSATWKSSDDSKSGNSWKSWKNSGNSWGERSYAKQRSRDRTDRSGKREQYGDENRDVRQRERERERERGEQSKMRARTKETKYNKQRNLSGAVANSNIANGNGKEELYSKMQRRVMADNRRLKMGSNYSSNPYEDTHETEMRSASKAEQDEDETDEVVRFSSSKPKDLPQRSAKSSRRRERERERAHRERVREQPIAVAGPPPSSTMTVPMAAAISATSSIPNVNVMPSQRVSSSMLPLHPLFPPQPQPHPVHSASAHTASVSASASKPYHPMPSVTNATTTTHAAATTAPTNVYHTYRTTQSTPNPNPNPPPHPYGHSHFPSVANGYKAHTPHERVTAQEPTGYYGSNLGWGPSWSPRRKRKYVLVQKNQTIY